MRSTKQNHVKRYELQNKNKEIQGKRKFNKDADADAKSHLWPRFLSRRQRKSTNSFSWQILEKEEIKRLKNKEWSVWPILA